VLAGLVDNQCLAALGPDRALQGPKAAVDRGVRLQPAVRSSGGFNRQNLIGRHEPGDKHAPVADVRSAVDEVFVAPEQTWK
jgi:hypothetical protein